MVLHNIIQRATDFGTLRSRKNFFSFALKCVFYIIPAIILGHYSDLIVKQIQKYKVLGNYLLCYILLQTCIIISILYLILLSFSGYTNEFQNTIAGGFFIVLFFGMQTNYMSMIKQYMNNISFLFHRNYFRQITRKIGIDPPFNR